MPYEDRSSPGAAASAKKPHNITMEQRKKLSVSGVEDVESFDEHEIVMQTTQGCLIVRGEGLSVGKLSVDNGDVTVEGKVTELRYEETSGERGLWARLFH